jgi:hypothetical protein
MNSLPLGGIISLLVLLPNLLLVIFPSKMMDGKSDSSGKLIFITILERTGQVGCFVLPFFYRLTFPSKFEVMMIVTMAVILLLYYVCWVRFFLNGRGVEWFYRSMFGMNLPMAVLPVLYFLIASVLLQSLWLFIADAIFAAGHLSESWSRYQNILKMH